MEQAVQQNENEKGVDCSAPGYRKVTIESVTKCYGNCDGCTLSDAERGDGDGPQASALAWATSFAKSALSVVRKRDEDGGSFIVFGQGEHLTIDPPERIADLAKSASPFPITINEFTTALLMPNAQARPLLQRVYERSLEHPVALLPNIVFSPRKVLPTGFRREYLSNIESAVEIFGISDFTVNLGADVVDLVSPKEFDELMTLSGIRSMEINLIPVDGSVALMRARWPEIVRWMTQLARLWLPNRRKYRLAYPIALAMLIEKTYGRTVPEAMDFLQEHFSSELYVDLSGSVYLAGSGGAGVTVPFYGKNGYRAVATGYPVHDAALDATLRAQAGRTALSMSVAHQRYEACRSCPYLVTCIASGFTPALTQFRLDPKAVGSACPLGVIELMRTAHESMGASSIYDMDIFHGHVAQSGLKDRVDDRVLHRPQDFQSPVRVPFNEAAAGSIGRIAPAGVRPLVRAPSKPKFAMKIVVEAADMRALDLPAIGRAITSLQGDADGDGVWERGTCDFEPYPANTSLMSEADWDEFVGWAAGALGPKAAVHVGVRPRMGEALERALAGAKRLSGVVEMAMPEIWLQREDLPGGGCADEALAAVRHTARAVGGFCALQITLDEDLCRALPPQEMHEWIVRSGAGRVTFALRGGAGVDPRPLYAYLDAFESVREQAGLRIDSPLIGSMEEALRSTRGAPLELVQEKMRARMATCVAIRADGSVHPLLTSTTVDAGGQPVQACASAPGRVDAMQWVAMRREIRIAAGNAVPDAPECLGCAARMACAMAGVPRAVAGDPGCPSGAKPLFERIARRIARSAGA